MLHRESRDIPRRDPLDPADRDAFEAMLTRDPKYRQYIWDRASTGTLSEREETMLLNLAWGLTLPQKSWGGSMKAHLQEPKWRRMRVRLIRLMRNLLENTDD